MKDKIIKTEIVVKENKIGIMRVGLTNFISLTDLARYQNSSDPSFTVKNWLRRVTTIDYIGLWEQINNTDFNLVEFDQIKTEYGKNSFAMSPTQWIKRTNAIGLPREVDIVLEHMHIRILLLNLLVGYHRNSNYT